MGKWAKKAVKTDILQWMVDEVKNHLEPLFGTKAKAKKVNFGDKACSDKVE